MRLKDMNLEELQKSLTSTADNYQRQLEELKEKKKQEEKKIREEIAKRKARDRNKLQKAIGDYVYTRYKDKITMENYKYVLDTIFRNTDTDEIFEVAKYCNLESVPTDNMAQSDISADTSDEDIADMIKEFELGDTSPESYYESSVIPREVGENNSGRSEA